MNTGLLLQGLMLFLAFIAFTALHEYAHAWTACRLGDDTPRVQGRLTLDPTAHIDLIGTIILPLVMVLLGAMSGSTMLFGWGKPVEVNLDNFKHRRRDDILVSGAGPAMNLVLVVVLFAIMKVVELAGGAETYLNAMLPLARLSMLLCIFNLLPIPPLDGGHIMRNLAGISDEVYNAISSFSFLFLIMILRVPAISQFVRLTTNAGLQLIAWPFGWTLSFS